jgi:branched-chain amino acid transport system ATP-binding protein
MLELSKVDTYYGETQILHQVSLKIPPCSVVAMLGRNGMGKTTIIRSIMGIAPPRNGTILFNQEKISGLEPNQIAGKGLGLVPQGRGIFPSLSVRENLTMAARNNNQTGAWNLERIYGLFPILKLRARLYANLLSGGEQQMLSVARALMINPGVLIMDEPSEGLAPMVVRGIMNVIAQLKCDHSILLAEQNINMALGVADYVYIINKGEVVHESKPQDLKGNHEIMTKYLGV